MAEHDLSGRWRFRPDPHGLGEHFADRLHYTHAADERWMGVDYDDSAWAEIAVPACWQAEGWDLHGLAWYRRTFEDPRSAAGERVFLRFGGVDYLADVWLNGRLLGSHEGYFDRFEFEVTDRLRDDNTLAVRVCSPVDVLGVEHEQGQLKTLLKGALGRWDMNDPEMKPGGIWNRVTLDVTGPTRVSDIRVRSWPLRAPVPSAPDTPVEVAVAVDAVVSRPPDGEPVPGHARAVVRELHTGRPVGTAEHAVMLVPGRQSVALTLLVEASLWWTWDLGPQPLYEVAISVQTATGEEHATGLTFGVRQLRRGEGQALYLNGHRFFQRGANYVSDQLQSLMTAERYGRDVELMREANLNTVHPFCHVERDELYDACDRVGLLVYQDMPMWMMMDTGSDLVRRAEQQLERLIAQRGHHPSIAVWNLGSQPSLANFEKLCSALARRARTLDASREVQQANATFAYGNEYVHSERSLFWPVERGARYADEDDWPYDTHVYTGWYYGDPQDLDTLPREHLQLVTEFGAQALPSAEALRDMLGDQDAFPPNWNAYARRCAQPDLLRSRAGEQPTLEELVAASQRYQAKLLRSHIEHYRRRKLAPCNGAHVFAFNDCWPAITWSILDYERRPKLAYDAVTRAMQPLIALLDPFEQPATVGEPTLIRIVLVSDLRSAQHVEVDAHIAADEHHVPADVPANAVIELPAFTWTPTAPGTHHIAIEVQGADVVSRNDYDIEVAG